MTTKFPGKLSAKMTIFDKDFQHLCILMTFMPTYSYMGNNFKHASVCNFGTF